MSDSFSCRCCGHCCEGRGGIVVSPSDCDRLCAFLKICPEEFETQWGERRGGKLHVRASDENRCVFFTQGRGCSVHEAKPDICRAWPYFRGNLVDPESLSLAREFCPGIPAEQSFTSFAKEGFAYLHAQGLVRSGAEEGVAKALCVADLLPQLARNSEKA